MIISIFLALGLMLSGCSMFQKKDDATTDKTEDISTIVIGEKTENSKQVTLINDTGDKIIGLFIKKSGEENYKNNLLAADGAMDRKDKRILYIENSTDTYDMTILVNQKNYVLHDIPFYASNTFEIHLAEEYGYVIYNEGNNVVSTEEAERNRLQNPEEEIIEEPVVEEVPVEEAYNPNANYNPNTNYNYYYYEDNTSGSEEQPVVPDQPQPEEPVVVPDPIPVEPVVPEPTGE